MKIFLDKNQIQDLVKDLAQAIDTFERPEVIICALSGGFMFFNDIVRRLRYDFEIDFIKPMTYGLADTTFTTSNSIVDKTAIIGSLTSNIKDKSVMVLDDIIDSGSTLVSLTKYLQQFNPKSILICSLLKRKSFVLDKDLGIRIGYGLEVEDGWFSGYGMNDDKGFKRIKENIYVK